MKYLRIRKEANKNSRDSKRVPAEKMELAVNYKKRVSEWVF